MARAASPARRRGGTAAGDDASSSRRDRKSTRLNSSHSQISYAVFCLKKKKHTLEPLSRYLFTALAMTIRLVPSIQSSLNVSQPHPTTLITHSAGRPLSARARAHADAV